MHAARAHSPATGRVPVAALALCVAALLGACRTHPPAPAPAPPTAPSPTAVAAVTTRGEFTVAATKLDAWNAVGQIVVRTPGATYEGRSQMLDLYTVRYRDQPFLLVTRALLLSDTIRDTTTLVTARTLDGKPIDSDASAELLALLQRELPAQIEKDRAAQAAEAAAKKAKSEASKAKPRKKK
ncbi:MAG: hypothetical protein ACJ8GK_03695 [Luteimonas sp.]